MEVQAAAWQLPGLPAPRSLPHVEAQVRDEETHWQFSDVADIHFCRTVMDSSNKGNLDYGKLTGFEMARVILLAACTDDS